MFQVMPDAPVIVAANRDERLDRPAVPVTVLRERAPRILGGRDLLAGGTWLAVNERGVVAGLTNQPSADGRDPTKRSRGELPLTCAGHDSAAEAVAALSAEIDPRQYNPCWMLVGDRNVLFSVGLSGGTKPEVEKLAPGVHVLENAPLRAESAKAAFVTDLVRQARAAQADESVAATVAALQEVLRDHRPAVPEPRTDAAGRTWPASLTAACVHADGYGTRSSMVVTVPAAGLPTVLTADGWPCEAPMGDASALWTTDQVSEPAH